MADLAVVHLVRRQNGTAPFRRFLASLKAHPAGVPYDLVIVFKGFGSDQVAEYEQLLKGTSHHRMFVSDRGFDINAYFGAVEKFDYAYFCFLNSYSQILADGWLEKLRRWMDVSGVGLVGATGSWQSIAGGYTTEQRRLQGMPPVTRTGVRIWRALKDRRPRAMAQRALRVLFRLAGIWRPARDFPPFPNFHLRTNAFMASRATLRAVRPGPMRLKLTAYRFESGRDSLTNQVRSLGQAVRVVGRDGEAYEPERWHLSNTFWQSRQENLLVADNQTESYAAADQAGRAELAQYAWGDRALPG